jgi:hypothetical protein
MQVHILIGTFLLDVTDALQCLEAWLLLYLFLLLLLKLLLLLILLQECHLLRLLLLLLQLLFSLIWLFFPAIIVFIGLFLSRLLRS